MREVCLEAVDAALRGDVAPALGLARDPSTVEPWRTVAAMVSEPDRALEALEALDALRDDGGSPEGHALACALGARGALRRMEIERSRALAARALVHARGAPAPRVALAAAWSDAIAGDAPGARARLEPALAHARRDGVADVVVEGTALLALLALEAGALDEARAAARRAVRMAQSEQLAEAQYLSGAILARVRRASRQPYLAVRILRSIAKVAPPSWRALLGLEGIAAGIDLLGDGRRADGSTLLAAARSLVDAARAGEQDRFARAVAQIPGASPWACDLRLAAAMISPDVEPPEDARAWCAAERVPAPRGLQAFGSATGASDVMLRLGPAQPRRFLALGAALARIDPSTRAPTSVTPRVRAAIAVLGSAHRERIPLPALFRAVYGFAYRSGLHRGMIDVLVHRVRAALEGVGTLVVEDGHAVMVLESALLVPDPWEDASLPDRLLRALGERPGATPREVAQQLGVQLRHAQRVLRELADDGSCQVERAGRTLHYRVEDTTFDPPTRQ
jgi:hypothetical protein